MQKNKILTILIFVVFVNLSIPGCGKNRAYSDDDFRKNYRASEFRLSDTGWGIWLDATSGTVRDKVYVIKTGDVTDEVYNLVVQGLVKVIKETGRSISVAGEDTSVPSEYMPADWYRDQTMTDREKMHGLQANGSKIIDLLRSHALSDDHFIVLITGCDLTSGEPGNNFVYGLSNYPYIVISAKRFMDWKRIRTGGYSEEIYNKSVSLLSAHEFGHYLDLTRRNFNCWMNTGTLLDNHCKGKNGLCLMQQVNVDAEGCRTALEQTDLMFDNEHWLCPDCAAEIYYRRESLVKSGFSW